MCSVCDGYVAFTLLKSHGYALLQALRDLGAQLVAMICKRWGEYVKDKR